MSDKSIAERLQVKKERRLAVIDATPALDRVVGAPTQRAVPDQADVVLLFVANRKTFSSALPKLLKRIQPDAILWLAYPKLTSKPAVDLSRDVIHGWVPEYGLDTVSQIAIDADWSALRLKRTGAKAW